ncbi:MAG: DivIVA domain-containing protein [Ruminococcus sp.]
MLTVDEIKNVTFRKGRGYRDEDVDAFIDEVIVSFEQLKKEKSDLVRKMDILATRVEQYRADEETVRNALLASQRVADSTIKESNAQAATIVAEAEAKAQKMLLEANEVTAKQKEVYLKLKADAAKLRKELSALYNSHLKTIEDFPTDAVVAVEKQKLDKQYPTKAVEEKPVEKPVLETPVEVEPVQEEVVSQNVEFVASDESKFADLKFGDNYDVDAE